MLCRHINFLSYSVVISTSIWHSCQDRAAPDMPLSRNIVLLLCAGVVTMTSIGMNSFSLFLREPAAGRRQPCQTCLTLLTHLYRNNAKHALYGLCGYRAGSGPSLETFFSRSITSASRGISLIAFSISSGMSGSGSSPVRILYSR